MDYLELDVSSLAREDQFAAWAGTQRPYSVRQPSQDAGFHAVARAWLLPPLIVSESALGAFASARTREATGDGEDGVTVQLFVAGGMAGRAGERQFRVGTGQIAIQDASCPFEARVSASRTVVITMPRAAIEEDLNVSRHHGAVLDGGLAIALRGLMYSLPEALAAAEHAAAIELSHTLRRLLVAVLRERDARDPAHERRERAIRARAKRLITTNLAGDLSVAALCERIGASRSALYRAFAPDGGIANYVKLRRLYKVRHLLADRSEQRSVMALAAAYGFTDPSHFHREFRRAFGRTPGEVRRAEPPGREMPHGSPQQTFADWVRTSVHR